MQKRHTRCNISHARNQPCIYKQNETQALSFKLTEIICEEIRLND